MQLELKEGIEIVIHNKDYAMGCYYAEDDWDIKSVAPTYEEAIKQIIPEYVKSGIYPSGNYISAVKYVVYNNKYTVVDDTDKTPFMYKDKNIISDITKHPLFKKLHIEKNHKIAEETANKLKSEIQEKEKHERELLKELKKKYND